VELEHHLAYEAISAFFLFSQFLDSPSYKPPKVVSKNQKKGRHGEEGALHLFTRGAGMYHGVFQTRAVYHHLPRCAHRADCAQCAAGMHKERQLRFCICQQKRGNSARLAIAELGRGRSPAGLESAQQELHAPTWRTQVCTGCHPSA
jgi:hypothetical protein